MSGSNPFRRSRLLAQHSVNPTSHNNVESEERARAEKIFPPLDTDESPRPSPKIKTVRIASPPVPITPEDPPSWSPWTPSGPEFPRQSDRDTFPPPTISDRQIPETPSTADPFNAESSDGDTSGDDELVQNTRRNSERSLSAGGKAQAGISIPVKSALSRSKEPIPHPSFGVHNGGAYGAGRNIGIGKGTMDVDAFTRLLLTGERTTSASPVPPKHSLQPHGPGAILSDNSSSTDASSISRQSIFEPLSETQQETPRTSHEVSLDDDERSKLIGSKPSPPKTRHGKLIKSSISSSTLSESQSSFSSHTPTASISQVPLTASPTSPQISDLNKPLPAPPNLHPQPAASISSTSSDRPKRPPTPPITRRQSTKRHSDQHTSSSISPLTSNRPASLRSIDSQTRNPPAPPPPRRKTSLGTSQAPKSHSPDSTTKKQPPPHNSSSSSSRPTPPSRTPSISSITSPSNSKPPRNRLSMPPPPPPPRNTNSNRLRTSSLNSQDSSRSASGSGPGPGTQAPRTPSGSSMDLSRLSPEGTQPATSISTSTTRTRTRTDSDASTATKKSTAGNILADLKALQREVDALRGGYKTEGGGASRKDGGDGSGKEDGL
ncbi:MAG: hypothetical protein M1834_001386 [Cirrosporium novae-zelandiae]|nr:MAG: hypothetical protein M1834_001386 [Cirrosporium novae-zelandiae]